MKVKYVKSSFFPTSSESASSLFYRLIYKLLTCRRLYILCKSILLLSFSCVHKNADKKVWKDLQEKVTIANANKDKYKDSFPMDSLGKIRYPDYYAGSYVNSTYELTVGIVGDTSVYRDEIRKVLGNDSFLITESEYSYNHLLSKYDSLIIVLKPLLEEKDTGGIEHYEIGINDLYISEEENRIVVELIEIDSIHVHRFLNQISNMPEIQFKKVDLPVLH